MDAAGHHARRSGRPGSAEGAVAALLADTGDEEWLARVPGRLDAFLPGLPAPVRTGGRAARTAMDAYAVLHSGRRLAALTPGERETVLASLAAHPALVPALDLLKVPGLLAAATELTPAPPAPPAPDDPPLDCTPAEEWPERATADAVVVGSGAGGAIAARTRLPRPLLPTDLRRRTQLTHAHDVYAKGT